MVGQFPQWAFEYAVLAWTPFVCILHFGGHTCMPCCPHFILYHISIVYQADVGNNIFLSSPLPLEISIFATISRTATPAIVYQGGAGGPPSPRALPNWSGPHLIITDAKNWSKLIITDGAKTSAMWTTWVEKLWMIYHSLFLYNEVTDW